MGINIPSTFRSHGWCLLLLSPEYAIFKNLLSSLGGRKGSSIRDYCFIFVLRKPLLDKLKDPLWDLH